MSDTKVRYERKPLTNAKGYPYRKARLVGDDITKEWHIVFYAWDIGLNKLVRKRVGKEELNSIHDIRERKLKAIELINDLNETLAEGGYLKSEQKKSTVQAFNFHGYKLIDAFTYVENHKRDIEKKSPATAKEYRYTRTTLTEFMTLEGINQNILLRQINSDFLHRYCFYLRDIRKISNKTYNDRLGNMHSCFETLRKLDPKLWPDRNPCHRLEKLLVTSKTHAAYTTTQLNQFIEAIAPKDPQLLLFIRFIYYTLARPKELRHLKVGHIRSDFSKILFVGEHAKTDKEKYIGISEEFANVIASSGILNYPADYYVFGSAGIPSITKVGNSYFYKRFKVYLRELGFKKLNPAYTMYSFKHTGAVQLYLASKDVYLVQQQLRHTTLDQTTTYLRDLGLFVNFDGLKNWKGF